jgi:hypothetical protein
MGESLVDGLSSPHNFMPDSKLSKNIGPQLGLGPVHVHRQQTILSEIKKCTSPTGMRG